MLPAPDGPLPVPPPLRRSFGNHISLSGPVVTHESFVREALQLVT